MMITEGKKKKKGREKKRGGCVSKAASPSVEQAQAGPDHCAWQIGGVRDSCEHDEGAARAGLGRKIKRLKHGWSGQERRQPPPHAPKGGESFAASPRDCMIEDPEQKEGTRVISGASGFSCETTACGMASPRVLKWGWAEHSEFPSGSNPGNAQGTGAYHFHSCHLFFSPSLSVHCLFTQNVHII